MWKFKNVNPKQSFPKLEEEVLKYWEQNKIFEKSIQNREGSEEFDFYDGPPFATGLPHYGHLLAWTIKDVVPRYQTMRWKKVERIFWWDCHGLPIENLVEKLLNISWKDEIENKIWVDKFNETCRNNVLKFTQEWKKIVKRVWRWVDIDNPYIAMDPDFMEAVWWVFKKLYEKDLVYEGYKVVPYCPRCSTALSNFEVAQGYKDKSDKAITVKFKIKWENKYILAWTTTPWTLAANLALAVGKDIEYVEILDKTNNETYILAKELLSRYYKNQDDYEILKTYKWKDLVWIEYEPVLGEILDENSENIQIKNAYKVVIWHHVSVDSWTGIVHIAPTYWEDDYQIWQENNIGLISHIDDTWKTRSLKEPWNGKYVFDFNQEIIDYLKNKNLIVKIESITHSYPHCWRCDTPLIYRAIPAWYVKVTQIKDQMIENNQKVHWVPKHIWTWRFWKWLENAKDWNISRNRYWATPIPVWKSEDWKLIKVIWTLDELFKSNKPLGQITKVIWVRHWRTDYNDKHLMDYKDKAKLTEVGLQQAKQLSERLKDLDIDAIYSSPLSRCIDTIKPLALEKNLKINIVDDLIEINSPDLQDKEFSCKNYKWDNGYGWGEKISEVYERVTKAFKKIIDENKWKTVVIVSHGDPIVLMRKLTKDFDYDTEKYTCWLYLENNPEKWWIEKMYYIDYVYTDNYQLVDLHKHFVDKIKLVDENNNVYTRIPELLDVWFDSWSMPYSLARILAKRKYNLNSVDFFKFMDNLIQQTNELKESFDYRKYEDLLKNLTEKLFGVANSKLFKFPANFIAEGQDQTRWWFYTLMVLWTALFNNTPFYNVIVNWIILAEDWKKMSKRLKNYPDPMYIVNKYWADSMRFYMMNSPAVAAQELRFSEKQVEETMRKVILPLWNTYYFFTTYANIDNWDFAASSYTKKENQLDKWILSELNKLIKDVQQAMDNYTLMNATKYIVEFMDNLTNWYIRRSRRRFWKSENDNDKIQAYETLHEVLVKLTQVLAPFSPFITDYIYQDLTKKESVHLSDWSEYDESLIDEKLNEQMQLAKNIVSLWLSWRARNKIRVRQPLNWVKITKDLPEYYKKIIKDELNVKEVLVSTDLAMQIAKPEWRKIWPKYWKLVQEIIKNAKEWNFKKEQDKIIVKTSQWDITLEKDEYTLEFIPKDKTLDLESWFGIVVALDKNITEDLLLEWYARDIVRFIQELRKQAGYHVSDRIKVSIKWDEQIQKVLEKFKDYIEKETLSTITDDILEPDIEDLPDIEWLKVLLKLKK